MHGFFQRALIVVLLGTGHMTMAQEWPFELWHEGKIVLEEGDTLKGLVKYDQQQDLVQYAIKNQPASIYTARKVIFFEIFDNTIHRYRKFFTLPFNTAGQYKAPVFFELLAEGKMTLLSREYLEYKSTSSPTYIGSYSRQVLMNRYYFLKEDGTIEEFIGKKNDLINLMGKKGSEVNKYIKTNRLRYERKDDMARIVIFYNSLWNKPISKDQ